MTPPLCQKAKEELKSLLMKVKKESEQVGWKLNIQKTKIMASSPISSVLFSRSVISDSLWPHDLQHARLPCPSSTSTLLNMPKPLIVWITTNCGKFFKWWKYQTTWPASWEICMQVKKQQLLPDMEQDWFQIGKGVCQGCILSPCLFNLCAEYIMRNTGLNEAQAGIKIAGRNINNLRYTDDTTLMEESKEELKTLDESKRG